MNLPHGPLATLPPSLPNNINTSSQPSVQHPPNPSFSASNHSLPPTPSPDSPDINNNLPRLPAFNDPYANKGKPNDDVLKNINLHPIPGCLYGPPDLDVPTTYVGNYTLYGTIGQGAFGKYVYKLFPPFLHFFIF